jgi:uncharacterized protein YecT (DUF1311 family)
VQKFTLVILAFVGFTGSASAQELDCSDSTNMSQMDMNQCAHQFFQYADEDLNLAYQQARATLKQFDSDAVGDNAKGAKMLRDAQRAWIDFRDNACAAEAYLYQGGSIQPLIDLSCKERLTRQRTEGLRSAFETN